MRPAAADYLRMARKYPYIVQVAPHEGNVFKRTHGVEKRVATPLGAGEEACSRRVRRDRAATGASSMPGRTDAEPPVVPRRDRHVGGGVRFPPAKARRALFDRLTAARFVQRQGLADAF